MDEWVNELVVTQTLSKGCCDIVKGLALSSGPLL